MKKYWRVMLVLLLVVALAVPAVASQAIKINVDGEDLITDVPAQIIDGRTMVPIRAIAESIGKTVDYNSATMTVTIAGLSDLEKVAAISTEWAATGHADTGEEVFGHAATSNNCVQCHSGNGFERYLTDNPFKPADVPEGAEHGEMPRTIDCATCHGAKGQGLIDTEVAKAELVPFANADFKAPGSALCMSCHNGRRNPADLYQKWSTGAAKPVDYPHHGESSLFAGKGRGGVEYPDGTYYNSEAHQTLGCASCHMPKTAAGYVSHNFNMDVAYIEQTCGSCHKGATDYRVGGNLKAEIGAMLEELHEAAVAAVPGAVRVGQSRLEFPFADAEGKRVDVKNVSTEAWVAAYNYYLLKDDLEHFSGGAHNPQYAKSLIRESLKKLK